MGWLRSWRVECRVQQLWVLCVWGSWMLVMCVITARRFASALLATAIPSVRLSLSVHPSVTRRYCVKTMARSTVQFALSDSKMCLVLYKPKSIPHGRPLPPEIFAWTDLRPPDSSESWHVLPCSASTERASENSSIVTNRKSYTGFPTNHQPRFYTAPNFL